MQVKVLDFYSGIGGMHCGLVQMQNGSPPSQLAGKVFFEVLDAFDVNTVANEVYKHNFSKKVVQKGIDTLTAQALDKYDAQLWVCSPPCQPYTVQGNRRDTEDPRAQSFLHLLDVLEEMQSPPKYILVENVKGFEVSKTFERLCDVLGRLDMVWQIQTLSPLDFGIPNSRTRVFVLAKKKPLAFARESLDLQAFSVATDKPEHGRPVSYYIDQGVDHTPYFVSEETLEKHGKCVDVVSATDRRTCCFTKNYNRYVEGTGSLFQTVDVDKEAADRDGVSWLPGAKVRYFTPSEVCRLHHYPDFFSFPSTTTDRQKYQLLGNSLNVHVVASLVAHMMSGDSTE